jgi:pimeloyl-ACP methyl ester carboxylesterase/DNA-binding CsgD family transcriptional regulator
MDHQLGFCTTPDGVRICYATAGEGSPLVSAPNWLSHLELEKRSPVWRHWWEELGKDHLLVRLDQRGCGLSDWAVKDLSFAGRVIDIETVVDAMGLDRFALLGISQGGPTAIEFAVRHPQKVSHLILYGAYARGASRRGRPPEEQQALLTLMRLGWRQDNPAYRQIFTSKFLPEATAEQMRWFDELQRLSASPENAVETSIVSNNIDILDRLPRVTVPTLILHARGDALVPFEEGQQLASLIPNHIFVPLESKNHLLLETEPAWLTFLKAVRGFLRHAGAGSLASTPAKPSMSDIHQGEAAKREKKAPAGWIEVDGNVDPAYPNGLTQREVEVLRLIAEGKSNRAIAEDLVISLNTVAHHVSNILAKTDAHNRAGIATYASRNGLISV